METFNSIINASQLTLVDFFATWCGPCKTMHPVLEQLKAELGSGIRIIKIDVDKNAELSNAYRLIYSEGIIADGLKKVQSELQVTPEIQYIIDFISTSKRGIIR